MLLFFMCPFLSFPSSSASGHKFELLTLAFSLSQKNLQLDNTPIRTAYIVLYGIFTVRRRVYILA